MPLSQEELDAALSALPGWRMEGQAIVKDYAAGNFNDAVELVNRIAEAAEAVNHHPDIDIRAGTVRLAVFTHSDGAVTDKDIALAQEIEAVLQE